MGAEFVKVDYELRGCPISAKQLLEFLRAVLSGEKPRFPTYSVCTECKLRGVTCLAVSRGEPCMGPITQAGCGALCPGFNRGCYGCFGPCEEANVEAYKKLAGAHDAVRRLKMIVTNFETPKGATQ